MSKETKRRMTELEKIYNPESPEFVICGPDEEPLIVLDRDGAHRLFPRIEKQR